MASASDDGKVTTGGEAETASAGVKLGFETPADSADSKAAESSSVAAADADADANTKGSGSQDTATAAATPAQSSAPIGKHRDNPSRRSRRRVVLVGALLALVVAAAVVVLLPAARNAVVSLAGSGVSGSGERAGANVNVSQGNAGGSSPQGAASSGEGITARQQPGAGGADSVGGAARSGAPTPARGGLGSAQSAPRAALPTTPQRGANVAGGDSGGSTSAAGIGASSSPAQGGAEQQLTRSQVEFYRQLAAVVNGLGEQMNATRGDSEALAAALGDIQQRVLRLEGTAGEIARYLQDIQDKSVPNAAFIALLDVERAYRAGRSFGLPLRVLIATMPADAARAGVMLDGIAAFADEGIPQRDNLLAVFTQLRTAAVAGNAGGAGDGFWGYLSGLVSLEKIDNTDSSSVVGTLNVMERGLRRGDLETVLRVAGGLSAPARERFEPWLAQVDRSYRVELAITAAQEALRSAAGNVAAGNWR